MRNSLPLLLTAAAMVYAQKPKDNPADWPMYTRDLAGTRYSPLKQINAANVSKLTEAWTLQACRRSGSNTCRRSRGRPSGGRQWRFRCRGCRTRTWRAWRRTRPRRQPRSHADRRQWLDVPSGRPARYCARSRNRQRSRGPRNCRSPPRPRGVAFWPGDANNPPRIILTAGTEPDRPQRELRARSIPASAKKASSISPCPGTACRRSSKTWSCWARRWAKFPSGRLAIRAHTMPAPAPSSGTFIPFPQPGEPGFRHLGERQLERLLRRQRLGLVSHRR